LALQHLTYRPKSIDDPITPLLAKQIPSKPS